MKLAYEPRELVDYQAALLDALAAGGTADEVKKRLRRDPRAYPFREYVRSFDRRSVEALTKLMAVWGVRGDGGPSKAPGAAREPAPT